MYLCIILFLEEEFPIQRPFIQQKSMSLSPLLLVCHAEPNGPIIGSKPSLFLLI